MKSVETLNTSTEAQSASDLLETQKVFIERIFKTLHHPMDLQTLFDRVFPLESDLPAMLPQLSELKKCLDSFRPLDPDQLANLQSAWDTEYTYESNRIEGNTLTLQETHLVIAKGMTIDGKSIDEHLEARNHQEAIFYVRELAQKETVLTEYILNSIHSIVLSGIRPRDAGVYRRQEVMITGANHKPPQQYLVPKLMEDIFIWYNENKDTLHPVLLAADMHEKVVKVHPWIDGNGRTSRLLMNLILLQHGYPIARVSGENKARLAYYNALDAAQMGNDNEPFQRLIAEYVRKSLFEYLAMVSGSQQGEPKGSYFFEQIKPFLPVKE